MKPRTGYQIARARATDDLRRSLASQGREEHRLHAMIVDLMERTKLPGVVFWHTPNGARRSHAEAAALKALGLLAGVSDLAISMPDRRMGFMEVKSSDGVLSEAQEAFLTGMGRNGHLTAVVRSLDEAAMVLRDWGAIRAARVAA